jgi:H+/Cl- antiporter ClcA
MSYFLLGLQYCAGAFGMIMVAVIAGSIAYWLFRLIYGQSLASKSDEEAGAPEGEISHVNREDF